MTAVARKVWAALVKSMPEGVYSGCDTHLLAAYCEAVSVHQHMTAIIADASFAPISTGSTGQDVINPAYKEQANQARLIVTLGQRLGLDPAARQSLEIPEPQEEDEFDGLIN
jgi:P27 family predicted phage terminase small subunit